MSKIAASYLSSAGGLRPSDMDFTAGLRESVRGIRDILNQQQADKLAAEKQKQAEADRAWLLQQRNRQEAEWDRADKERAATGEALKAMLNPAEYSQAQLSPAEREQLQVSYSNLSPEERIQTQKAVEQNFVDRAMLNKDVDMNKVATLRNQLDIRDEAAFNKKIRTPGTPEYEAAKKAELGAYEDRLKLEKKYEGDEAAFNRRVKTPGTPEYEAAQKAELDAYENKLKLEKKYEKPAKEGNVTLSRVEEDGTVREIQVPASKVEIAEQAGFKLGSIKGTPTKQSSGYSSKDIDTMVAKVAPWNITGGDRDSLMKDINSYKQTLKEKGLNSSEINNVIGGALTQSVVDDEYDTSRFKNAILNRLEDFPSKGSTAVAEEPSKPTKVNKEVLNEPTAPKRMAKTMAEVNRIKDDIASLRNPMFGASKIEPYIKDEIDRKYGAGTYDKYK